MTGHSGLSSPYKGLNAFQDSDLDALLFFGREREREVVAANLTAARLTVLYGPSGVGKSSLLSAAVARSLRALPERPLVVVFSRWSDDPAAAIADAVREAAGASTNGTALEALERAQSNRDVYVILDQAEEYFLYHAEDAGPGSFAELLPAMLGETYRINVLVSLREDSLAKLDRFTGLIPDVFENTLRLDRLDRDAARAAIVRPVERFAGLTRESLSVEPALVERVLGEVGTGQIEPALGGLGSVERRPDVARVEAPYLQLVMQRLWDEERAVDSTTLRLETLERLGGARRIVEEHLEGAMEELGGDQQDVAARLFNHLVTPSGTKIAHEVSDLADFGQVTVPQLQPVLATLAGRRILRSIEEPGGLRYEIFHDVLAEPVLAWRARHRTAREVERKLADAHRRRRRLQLLFGLLLVALALMTAVTLFALSQRSEARTQRSEARAQQAAAQRQARVAEQRTRTARAFKLEALARGKQTSDPELGLLLAREAVRVEETSTSRKTLLDALVASRLRRRFRFGQPVLRSVLLGNRLISATAGGSVVTSDSHTGRRLRSIATGLHASGATFADDGSALLTGTDGRLRLVRPSGAVSTVQLRFLVHGGRLAANRKRALAYNENGAYLVDVGSGDVLMTFPRADTLAAAISYDGKLAATGHAAKTVRVWRTATADRLEKLFTTVGDIGAVAVGPRDDLVASASSKGIAQVWRVKNSTPVAIFGGQTKGLLTDVGFSDDERRLVTASRDGTIGLWDIDRSASTAVLRRDRTPVTSAAFAVNGTRILSTSGDEARLWDARPDSKLEPHGSLDQLVTLAGRRLAATGRTLTPAERKQYLG